MDFSTVRENRVTEGSVLFYFKSARDYQSQGQNLGLKIQKNHSGKKELNSTKV